MNPTSLYIHIPWCVRKCPYCDFNSHQIPATSLPTKTYLQQLLSDLDHDIARFGIRPIETIFIGGGTPSVLNSDFYQALFQALHQRLPLRPNLEVTMEMNPGALEYHALEGYLAAGINRLSLGVQSFDMQQLKNLGRIHTAEDPIRAVQAMRAAGFVNFNLDLMHGLPNQSVTEGLQDLQMALDLKPTHLSWYELTLEPNTLFHAKPPALPNEEIISELQEQGQHLLAKHGYEQYEISAYALGNFVCQHNLNYWQFGDYFAIGAGAHSKLTDDETGQITRQIKWKQPKQYLATVEHFCQEEKYIALEEIPFEFMLNVLRLRRHYKEIALDLFTTRSKLPLTYLETGLLKAAQAGLITLMPKTFNLTALGERFCNDVMAIFLA